MIEDRDPETGYYRNHWPVLSKAIEGATIRALSLGVGVQSSTLALMAARHDIGPMPDCAIVADPMWESPLSYQYLEWLEQQLPFPVYRVSVGNIRDNILARRNINGGRFAAIPWFIINPDGSWGMGRRQCTKEYKLVPIKRKLRELAGLLPRQRAPKSLLIEQWIGISTDEVVRMKPSHDRWVINRWPLIEANMDRNGCIRWLQERQYPVPPKSACIGCPFHTNAMWREMRDNRPEEWEDAVLIDRALREGHAKGMNGIEFMHVDRVPLDQANIDIDNPDQLGFDLDCEGMCGV